MKSWCVCVLLGVFCAGIFVPIDALAQQPAAKKKEEKESIRRREPFEPIPPRREREPPQLQGIRENIQELEAQVRASNSRIQSLRGQNAEISEQAERTNKLATDFVNVAKTLPGMLAKCFEQETRIEIRVLEQSREDLKQHARDRGKEMLDNCYADYRSLLARVTNTQSQIALVQREIEKLRLDAKLNSDEIDILTTQLTAYIAALEFYRSAAGRGREQ